MLELAFLLLGLKGLNPLITSRAKSIAFIIFDMVIISLMVYAFFVDSSTHIEEALDCLAMITVSLQSAHKEVELLVQKSKYMEVIGHLDKFWNSNEFGELIGKKLKDVQKITGRGTNIYLCNLILGASVILSKPFFDTQRVLPFCCNSFCDIQASTICYISNYSIQLLFALSVVITISAFDSLLFALLVRIYCEFEKIKYVLTNVSIREKIEGDERLTLGHIARAAKHHNRVLRFIGELNNLMTYLLLHQFSYNLFGICASLFCMTYKGFPPPFEKMIRFIPFIHGHFFQIFIYCLAGDIISTQAESVAQAAYNSMWFIKHQPKLGKFIGLIIQNSQREVKFTAGGVWDLNLFTFVAIVRGSFSMLTFMQTMYSPQ